jgi:hypothetical protein
LPPVTTEPPVSLEPPWSTTPPVEGSDELPPVALEDAPPLLPTGWARLTTSGAPQAAPKIKPAATAEKSKLNETLPSFMMCLLAIITYRVPAEGLETETGRARKSQFVRDHIVLPASGGC